jgi:acetyltransferase-like isoleucine patch superfamily enzyme
MNTMFEQSEIYKIYPNVKLGSDAQIGDYVIIGAPPRGKQPGELRTIIGDNAVIRSHTVIYAGNAIGNTFQTGHGVMIRECNVIGDNVSVGTHSIIEHHVTIEDGVRIHSAAFIPEFTTLEQGCWIGPNVTMTNAYHPLCPKAKECLKGPTVKKNAKVGAGATILPTVVIGEGALVGAGCVVTKNVPAYKVVAGNPASVIKDVSELRCPFGLVERPYEFELEEE